MYTMTGSKQKGFRIYEGRQDKPVASLTHSGHGDFYTFERLSWEGEELTVTDSMKVRPGNIEPPTPEIAAWLMGLWADSAAA